MKATITLTAKGLPNPFIARPGLGFGTDASTPNFNSKNIWKAFIACLKDVVVTGLWTREQQRPQLRASTGGAQAVVTTATVVNGNTVTINGTAMTAAVHRSSQTLTCVSAIAGDTVVINGVTFTGTAGAVVHGDATFSIDTSDTATAASIADQVNYYVASDVLVWGKSAIGVVTLFAKLDPVTAAQATATDAYTLTTTGGTITAGGATFTGGLAAVNNEFDDKGNNATTAASLAANLALSTTALISGAVTGNNQSAIVTLASTAVGDWVNLRGEVLTAGVTATDLTVGGVRNPVVQPNYWCQAQSDTNDAISLCNCINAHPRLRELYYADNVAGAVTIHERSPTLGGGSYVTTSDGTRLAVTGTDPLKGGGVFGSNASVLIEAIASGVSGNAITIASSGGTVAITGSISRLAGGTSVVSTF